MSVFDVYGVLSFDVYGTLIDFERGILGALKPVLQSHCVRLSDEQILEVYGESEAEIQEGKFMPYKDVLRKKFPDIKIKFFKEKIKKESPPQKIQKVAPQDTPKKFMVEKATGKIKLVNKEKQ